MELNAKPVKKTAEAKKPLNISKKLTYLLSAERVEG